MSISSTTTTIKDTPLSPLAILLYSLANFGFGAFYAFNNYVLPQWIQGFTRNAALIGVMGGTHSFEGAVIQPIVGAWSDRLRSRFGRRRPFLLLFVPISALFMLLTPAAAHLSQSARLAAIVACVFLFTLTFNIAVDPYQALLADISSPSQRGRVTGFWYFLGAVGQVALLFIPASLELKFGIVAVVMVITTLATCLTTREPPLDSQPPASLQPHPNIKEHISGLLGALRGLRTLKQARHYLVMYFFYGAGVGAVVPFLSLFVEKITGCSHTASQHIIIALLAATALGSPPCGWIGDRIGSQRLLTVGIMLIAAAAVNGLWVTTQAEVVCVLILAGLGTAAQNASAYPLLIKLVPKEEIGLYTGLQTTSLSVAAPAAALVTGALINHNGYRTIFIVCFACTVLALLLLRRLDPAAAPNEIKNRELSIEL